MNSFCAFQFYMLKPEEQLQMYYSLTDSLTQRGILQH